MTTNPVDVRDFLNWLKTEADRAEDAGRRPKAPELGLVSDGMTCAYRTAAIELTRRLDGRDAAYAYMRSVADNTREATPDALPPHHAPPMTDAEADAVLDARLGESLEERS